MSMQDDPKHIYTKTDDGSMARASHMAGEDASRPGQDASGQGRNGTDADALLRSTAALLRSRRDELADGFMLNQYWEGYRNALTEIIYLLDDGDPSDIDEVMARRDEEERSSQATLSGNGGDIDPSEEKTSPSGSGREPGIGTEEADDAAGPLDGIDAPLVDLMSWPRFYPTRQRRDKWQSMKVLEEAAEVHAAAKDYIKEETGHDTMGRSMDDVRRELVDEVADLLQTTANLMAAYGVTPEELDGARTRNIGKSRSRGMFEDGPRTHMNRDDE